MRILVATLTPFPSGTAHLIHITSLAEGLARAGHEVRLVAAQRGPGWPGDGPLDSLGFLPSFEVTVLAGRDHRGQSLLNLARTTGLVRRWRPEAAVADDVRNAALLARLGVPTVLESHTMHYRHRLLGRLAMRTLARAPARRAVAAISVALRDDLRAGVGPHIDPLVVLPEATWTEESDLLGPLPGARPGAVQVGYTGALFPGRGIELLRTIATEVAEVDVHVIGGPADLADALRSEAGRPSNLLVHGPMPPASARAAQRGMDLLLAPYARRVSVVTGDDTSRWMSPMKVFEYLAAGRVVLASDLPVLREVLEDGVTARLLPPEDPAAWVAAVRGLAADPGARAELGAAARRRAVERHGWDARTRSLLDALAGPA